MRRENAKKLFSLIGEIDDEIIVEVDGFVGKMPKVIDFKARRMVYLAATAASIAFLVVGVGLLNQFGMESDELQSNDLAVESEMMEEFSADIAVEYVVDLTEYQINAILPTLNFNLEARSFFFHDGNLFEIEAVNNELGINIRIAENEILHTQMHVDIESTVRDVHGVEVTFYENRAASFVLADIAYYVSFLDEGIISQIILGGPADLSNISIP